MTPYDARAELYRNHETYEEVLALRLDPIATRVAVPHMARRDRHASVDWAIDHARLLIRTTRAKVAEALFAAMLGDRAPKDFDWTKFEQTEFEQLQTEAAELRKRVERLQQIRLLYRAFMKANGKSPDAIEKAA